MAPHPTSEHHLQWLSMVRLQLLTARQQSASPPPLSSIALNTMQDAAESMLLLVSNKLGLALGKQPEFDALLGTIVKEIDDDDVRGYVSGLKMMNRARVNFKHNGNRADDSTVRQHMDTVDAAVSQLTRCVFGVELESLSLLTLVTNVFVRDRLKVAQQFRDEGKHAEAQADLGQAFHMLLSDYETRRSPPSRRRSSTKPPFAPRDERLEPRTQLRYLNDWCEAIDDRLKEVDEQLRVLSMGVDPQGYAFFRANTPQLMQMMNGDWIASYHGEVFELTDDEWSRCQRFVIETSLRLDSSDFEFRRPPRGLENTGIQVRRGVQADPVTSQVPREVTG